MRMRRTQQNLGETELFFASGDQMLASVDAQIHRNKGQSLALDLQHQHARIDVVVNRFFGVVGGDVYFRGSGKKLSLPDLLFTATGGRQIVGSCFNSHIGGTRGSQQESQVLLDPGVHLPVTLAEGQPLVHPQFRE